MHADKFRDLVRQMRAWQAEYFKTRKTHALIEARKFERAVDDELKGAPPRTLFDKEGD